MGDMGSISTLGRSPGNGKGYPLQYSSLENSMDCIVRGVAKSGTRLRDFHFHLTPSGNGGHLNKYTARQGQRIMKHIGSFQTSDKKAVHGLEFTGHSRTPFEMILLFLDEEMISLSQRDWLSFLPSSFPQLSREFP